MSSPLCICISISERGESKTRRHAAQGRAISVAMDGENFFIRWRSVGNSRLRYS